MKPKEHEGLLKQENRVHSRLVCTWSEFFDLFSLHEPQRWCRTSSIWFYYAIYSPSRISRTSHLSSTPEWNTFSSLARIFSCIVSGRAKILILLIQRFFLWHQLNGTLRNYLCLVLIWLALPKFLKMYSFLVFFSSNSLKKLTNNFWNCIQLVNESSMRTRWCITCLNPQMCITFTRKETDDVIKL